MLNYYLKNNCSYYVLVKAHGQTQQLLNGRIKIYLQKKKRKFRLLDVF